MATTDYSCLVNKLLDIVYQAIFRLYSSLSFCLFIEKTYILMLWFYTSLTSAIIVLFEKKYLTHIMMNFT